MCVKIIVELNDNSVKKIFIDRLYSQYFEESTDIDKLKTLLKFDRVVMEVLADALEAKSVIDCNPFFTSHLFKWYSTYVRSYELIIHANKLAKVSTKERRYILKMLQSLGNIDEVE